MIIMKKLLLALFVISSLSMAGKTDIQGLWGSSSNNTKKNKHKFRPKASVSTINNIKKNQNVLSNVSTKQSQLNSKLGKIAKNIMKAESDNEKLLNSIKRLKADMEANKEKYNSAKAKIAEFESQIGGLDQKIKQQQDKYVTILIDQFAMSLAIQESKQTTEESFILKETYQIYKNKSNKELLRLKSKMYKSQEDKKTVLGYQKKIKNSIEKITKKYELYEKKKKQQQKLLDELSSEELSYRKNIKSLVSKQNMIRSTLAKLNIIKKKEITEARIREEARQAEIKRRAEERRRIRLAKAKIAKENAKRARLAKEKLAKERRAREKIAKAKLAKAKKAKSKVDIKKLYQEIEAAKKADDKAEAKVMAKIKAETEQQVATKSFQSKKSIKLLSSSYHKDKIYAYRGSKTISPIRGAKVVKNFGTYVDPIYKMKIFNESITLKAPTPDAVVRNVLNGRVIFAGENNMLGKVIIVENANSLHTIYAGLSKISPLIKKGTKVRKGAVVGKVKRKLIFEATKGSKYINPARLITL